MRWLSEAEANKSEDPFYELLPFGFAQGATS